MGKQKRSEYLITRARYKAIKAFDHKQMGQLCSDIYKSGYEDGRASVPNIDLEAIITAIGKTKGIRSMKLECIRAKLR